MFKENSNVCSISSKEHSFKENTNPAAKICAIIPAYQPDEKLISLVENLISHFCKILIIDDGSGYEYQHIFEPCSKHQNVIVLRHAVNQGKGRALKTAFNYFCLNFSDCLGAVCLDCDGQHTVYDALNCASLLSPSNPFVIGTRNWSKQEIPFRSKFGNVLTKKIFSLLCGIKIEDTQSGLRAIHINLMPFLLSVSGERFEYETQVLLSLKERNIRLSQTPIKTLYISQNKSSHFNPLLDSFRIYRLFAKYLFSSVSSFAVDLSIFAFLIHILKPHTAAFYIFISTIAARICSSIFNFAINKNIVFKDKTSKKSKAFQYFALCAVSMFLSAYFTDALCKISNIYEPAVKISVDAVLFILNFVIQREIIFKNKTSTTGE